MTIDHGRSASPSGHSQAEPEEVSALRASVPNALAQLDCLVSALERVIEHKDLAPSKGHMPRILFASAVGCAEMQLYAWRATYPDTAQAVEAYRDYWADGGAWEQEHAASAIEARRAATEDTGAVNESAVLAEQAPNTGRGTSHG